MKHLIRNLAVIFVAIPIVLCFAGTSFAYTFDSEIDPIEFSSWEVTGRLQTNPLGGIVIVKNPDPNARIKEATLEIRNDGIISYEYDINGKTYKYEFNTETENYDLVIPKADPEIIPKE